MWWEYVDPRTGLRACLRRRVRIVNTGFVLPYLAHFLFSGVASCFACAGPRLSDLIPACVFWPLLGMAVHWANQQKRDRTEMTLWETQRWRNITMQFHTQEYYRITPCRWEGITGQKPHGISVSWFNAITGLPFTSRLSLLEEEWILLLLIILLIHSPELISKIPDMTVEFQNTKSCL